MDLWIMIDLLDPDSKGDTNLERPYYSSCPAKEELRGYGG